MTQPEKTQVWIVHERENPSTDYYILPRFDLKYYEVNTCLFDQVPLVEQLEGAIVVLVRYLPKAWRNVLSRHRLKLKQLIYFMDDDLFDWRATQSMPLRYRAKLFKQVTAYQKWLFQQKPVFWFSTPYLKDKYHRFDPVLIEPVPISTLEAGIKVFYHGSNSHRAEIDWLYQVIRLVLERDPSISFELMGGEHVNRLFRSLGQVQVMNYLSWPAYQRWLVQCRHDIGLVPLMDHPFNRARACVKFYDIVRAGAVGIYAQNSECGRWVEDQKEGVVLPMKPERWAEAILNLAKVPAKRQQMLTHSQKRCAQEFSNLASSDVF